MVLIDLQVAGGLDGQVEGRMFGQQRQHVIEESDAGGDLRLARAVQHQFQLDFAFPSFRVRSWHGDG